LVPWARCGGLQMGVAKQMSIPIHGWVLTMEGVHSNKGRWRKIEFGGFAPRRCNHSMTESPDGRYLFLFGGSDSAGECCNDLYVARPPVCLNFPTVATSLRRLAGLRSRIIEWTSVSHHPHLWLTREGTLIRQIAGTC